METSIHETAYIGDSVELGVDVCVGPHAVLLGPTRVGDGAYIAAGAAIGGPPEITTARQNVAWAGDIDHAGVEIEAGVVIRENVVIHQGSRRPTKVGAGSWLLNSSYLAHDVQIGSHVTVSAGVVIGGHAQIGDMANLGMNAAVHQRRIVGPGAMVGMGTPVTRDVPPFAMVFGVPPRLTGVNVVALRRVQAGDEVIELLASRYAASDLLLDDDGSRRGLERIAAQLEWWSAFGDKRPVRVASSTQNGTA